MKLSRIYVTLFLCLAPFALNAETKFTQFLDNHCFECHDEDVQEGNLDLTSMLPFKASDSENFRKWVKIHDRIQAGEMPPKKKPQPPAAAKAQTLSWLKEELIKAETARQNEVGVRTRIRRLTRQEYENTIRDLLHMEGFMVAKMLPEDGSAHGFDNNSQALDISHVNMAKYMEAANHALHYAIATHPKPPTVLTQRLHMASGVRHVFLHGDAVMLRNKKADTVFPPAAEHMHIGEGEHQKMGLSTSGASMGLFRDEDESFHPYFDDFISVYPGLYKLKFSLWSFQWDKGEVKPSRGNEVARLSIVTKTGDGRGGGHPSRLLDYFDAPSMESKIHETDVWLNIRETFGYNTATLTRPYQTRGPLRAMGVSAPGIALDYLEIQGPFYESWPPLSHKALFGDLPLQVFDPKANPETKPPTQMDFRKRWQPGKNERDPVEGIWSAHSENPIKDARKLLTQFLPRAFRRSVSPEIVEQYVGIVKQSLEAEACFENAMRAVYQTALCSPDFLFHVEPADQLDDYAIANRLSYFLWNSMPDPQLSKLASTGKIRQPKILQTEVERMLKDPKAERFIQDFPGQWLKLRDIAATDPDKKLYGEFDLYLQNSMVAETVEYFRTMLEKDLDGTHLVDSDFAMLNQRLAKHYKIEYVEGTTLRPVSLSNESPRGGIMTQGSVLKITANGTTTSPVPRGAYVNERLIGVPPDPPPPNVPAVEPDVSGAVTIRDQLAKHRDDPACAGCHAKLDPPGFALESFDVIGGYREKYRILTEEGRREEGSIVDPTGELPDGRKFQNIVELQKMLVQEREQLQSNLVRQLSVYSTGREVSFRDREQIAAIITQAEKNGNGGLRSLIHELVQSPLFQTR